MRLRQIAQRSSWILILVGLLVALPNGTVNAYLDPGSGSFIIQILIAALAGGLLTLRVFWGRIIGMFRKSDSPSDEDGGASSTDSGEQP